MTFLKYSLDNLPKINSTVLTLGVFDGVHLGHQKLLQELVSNRALLSKINSNPTISTKNSEIKSVVLTFDPHPAKFFQPGIDLELIQNIPERIEKIKSFGIDEVFVLDFNSSLANLEAEKFLQILVSKLSPAIIISTKNHYFGKDKKGDYQFLQKNQSKYSYKLVLVEPLKKEGEVINSSLIRQKILNHDFDEASCYLD